MKRGSNNLAQQSNNVPKRMTKQGLGRTICLGCLYYGADDFIATSENFWDPETITNHAEEKKRWNVRGSAIIDQNSLERLNNFHIDASLKLSFLGGLIDVHGSAEYLREQREKVNSVGVSYLYEVTYGTKSLTQKLKKKKDHGDLCQDEMVGKPGGPTHVVASITRGQRAVFSFKYDTKDTQANSKVEGFLKVAVDLLPGFAINGEANIKISEDEKITASELKCSFNSDFQMPKIPTNFKEAVEEYQRLGNLSDENTDFSKKRLHVRGMCAEFL